MHDAVACHAQVVDLTPDGHPDKPTGLNNLGLSWRRRFERLGELTDINNAIACKAQAVDLTPDGQPHKPACLSNLGISWQRRFERLGELTDINNAIACTTQAVDLTPDGHPDKPGHLSNLGISWQRRFERLDDLTDVDNAIACQTQAVDLTPDDHPHKPSCLNNLGISWQSRFERLGDLTDINNAVACQTQAVDLTPDGHPDRPGRLNNLGNSWQCRFERLGDLTDINNAIVCKTQAVDLTPDGHPDKPGRLTNLGNSWQRRFERLGVLTDMDNAIACHVKAADLTPDGHPDKPTCQSNLGNSWQCRFERLGDLTDINNAIACKAQAVDLTPDGHPHKPVCLSNLGSAHLARYESLNQLVNLELACAAFERAAISFVVSPRVQLDCARKWANTSLRLNLSPLEAFRTAFTLLPSLVWLGQTTQVRYSVMSSISDLVPAAAAWAFSTKSYSLALEWLEQGCSVIWRQMLQLRTPFDDLAVVDPELANELKATASQLDTACSPTSAAGTTSEPAVNLESQAQRHHSLALRWEKLLTEGRRLPGFHDFLLPTKAKILQKAARDGPIVIINTHSARCDALIILPQAEDMIHVPLPTFSEEKLTYMRTQCAAFSRHGGEVHPGRGVTNRRPQDALEPLASLWSDVVEPVLKRLPCA
ncbi:hypothetical protein FRC07_011688, partial [Ceratobasidium sp. 392]